MTQAQLTLDEILEAANDLELLDASVAAVDAGNAIDVVAHVAGVQQETVLAWLIASKDARWRRADRYAPH